MEEFAMEHQNSAGQKKFEVNIDSLLDVSVEISVEIGRTKLTIGELLSLSKGSIIELNRVAGESVDIFVNEKLLGKGEIVLVNERLGVRVIEILAYQGCFCHAGNPCRHCSPCPLLGKAQNPFSYRGTELWPEKGWFPLPRI
jgi:flagellar motor switch protein FliN